MDPEIMKKLPQRNEGGMVKIGDGKDGNISNMIALEDYGMLVVTNKSVWRIMTADNIDPQRDSINIPRHIQERILSYGSDDAIVGKTLLQGKELLLSNHLLGTINVQHAMQHVLSFSKELAALNDELKKLAEEYNEIQKHFNGRVQDDGSFILPSLKNLERRAKELIQNIDHMGGVIIDILKIFSIEIPKKNPLGKLIELTQQKYGNDHTITKAISKLKEKMAWLRLLRSDIEHPDATGIVTFENYKMNNLGEIKQPHIKHTRERSPFQSIDFIQLIIESKTDVMNLFETTLILLCDFYVEDFAGDKVFVRNVTDQERTEANPHMNYRYDVNWTR